MVLSSDAELYLINILEEENINIEIKEIRNDLNTFLAPYSTSFKRKLIYDVKVLRSKLDKILTIDKNQVLNSQILINISDLLNHFFNNLEYELDLSSFNGNSKFTDETKDYLLKLLEKYIITIYYGQLFSLVEIESFENGGGEKLDEMIQKFHWISVSHLELNLNEEDEDVRMFMYSAIRNLLLIISVKSPTQKLNCISQFCKFVMEALRESKDSELDNGNGNISKSISADDFLPTLIYTLLKAKIPQLLPHVSFINHFIGLRSDLEKGEIAYNFTNFNAALDFIQRLDGSKLTESDESQTVSRYFNNSVSIIHDEVRAMKENKKSMLEGLKNKINASQKLVATEISDMKEKKWWNVIKWIPLVNVGYGGVRSVCYICKGNKEEALNSLAGVAGGVVGVGAGIACAGLSGPMIVPIVAGLVCSGSANQAVTGGGELIVEASENPDLFKELSPDGREKKVYLKMIKDAPIVGMAYSSVRSIVYHVKGNKKESKTSIKNAAINGGASAVGTLAGVGMSKLSAQLTNIASTAADASDDIIKPASTEIIEFIAQQAARVAASPGANVVAHVGANSLSRYIIEEGVLNESDDCKF